MSPDDRADRDRRARQLYTRHRVSTDVGSSEGEGGRRVRAGRRRGHTALQPGSIVRSAYAEVVREETFVGETPDPNDYERRQREADPEMPEYDAVEDAHAQRAIADALRHRSFDLKYEEQCDRCKRLLPVGTKVVGRKLGERWVVEEYLCPQ